MHSQSNEERAIDLKKGLVQSKHRGIWGFDSASEGGQPGQRLGSLVKLEGALWSTHHVCSKCSGGKPGKLRTAGKATIDEELVR